jgi:hypothetical protein
MRPPLLRGREGVLGNRSLRSHGLYRTGGIISVTDTGRIMLFPAWMMRQVRPYRGNAERISIAFNLFV